MPEYLDINPEGKSNKPTKLALVLYGFTSNDMKIPYYVRDAYEANLLIGQLHKIGLYVLAFEVEVLLTFDSWHYPIPLKKNYLSLN
jgi:hypothetical protein